MKTYRIYYHNPITDKPTAGETSDDIDELETTARERIALCKPGTSAAIYRQSSLHVVRRIVR